MAAARHTPDADNLQILVDALVKECRFVTGGVSMQTLPQAPLPEGATPTRAYRRRRAPAACTRARASVLGPLSPFTATPHTSHPTSHIPPTASPSQPSMH
eukprot:7386522-Prymnesium_polylepis.1